MGQKKYTWSHFCLLSSFPFTNHEGFFRHPLFHSPKSPALTPPKTPTGAPMSAACVTLTLAFGASLGSLAPSSLEKRSEKPTGRTPGPHRCFVVFQELFSSCLVQRMFVSPSLFSKPTWNMLTTSRHRAAETEWRSASWSKRWPGLLTWWSCGSCVSHLFSHFCYSNFSGSCLKIRVPLLALLRELVDQAKPGSWKVPNCFNRQLSTEPGAAIRFSGHLLPTHLLPVIHVARNVHGHHIMANVRRPALASAVSGLHW